MRVRGYVPISLPAVCRLVRLLPYVSHRLCIVTYIPCCSFERTNQTQFLNTTDLPAVFAGIRQIRGSSSAILGNTTETNNETFPTSAASTSTDAGEVTGVPKTMIAMLLSGLMFGMAIVL